MKPTIWRTRLLTFRGISAGATHWYVRLVSDGRQVDVQWVLTPERALALNGAENGVLTYRAGEPNNRFDTEAEAVAAARLAWSWLDGEGGGLLLRGDAAVLDPQEPIDGEPGLVAVAQRFYDQAERLDWYEGDPSAMSRLTDEWMAWIRATFADRKPRDAAALPALFTITGALDNPDGVWCQR